MSLARSALLTALLAAFGLAAPSRSAGLNVSPVRVFLTRAAPKALLTVRNESTEPVRYQIQAQSWGEQPDGQMRLAPTQDLIVVPALLALKPGEEKNVRVGAGTQFGALEKTYRIFVEELRPAGKAAAPNQVRVLTRVGVPVFLAPSAEVRKHSFEDVSVAGGKLGFALANRGSLHDRLERIRVRGLAAAGPGAGEPLFTREQNGWYLLAGSSRRYELELPKESCGQVRLLEIEVSTDRGEQWTHPVPIPGGACAR